VPREYPLLSELRALDLMSMTPLQTLERLHEMQQRVL